MTVTCIQQQSHDRELTVVTCYHVILAMIFSTSTLQRPSSQVKVLTPVPSCLIRRSPIENHQNLILSPLGQSECPIATMIFTKCLLETSTGQTLVLMSSNSVCQSNPTMCLCMYYYAVYSLCLRYSGFITPPGLLMRDFFFNPPPATSS